jgi:hypothetical protein
LCNREVVIQTADLLPFLFVTECTQMLLPKKKRHEKRGQKRLDLHAQALVKKDGAEFVFSGELVNISDKGAYLQTNGIFSLNDALDLTIFYRHGANKLSMTFPCKVARIDGKGVGLTSSHFDATLLIRLELVFDVSKDNTRQLIEEFFKAI